MKKFYIFLLAVLAIPIHAMAEDEQEHLFPAVTFTYQGAEYIIPAWDALGEKGERVQSTFEKTNSSEGGEGGLDPSGPGSPGGGINIGDGDGRTEYNGIIVATGCALPADGGVPVGDFSAGDISIDGYDYDASTVTYADIFPDMDGEPLGNYLLFSTAKITGEYTVPETAPAFEDDQYANTYNIIGIGDGAYANKSWSHSDNTLYMQATKVTIPIHIKSLGKYSFLANGYMTEAIIPQESEIAKFPEGVFADCMRAKKLRLTNSLTSIESHAFGGCKVLRLLYAYNNESPVVAADAFAKYEGSTAEDCVPGKLAVWTYDMVAVRNYRAANALWNEFIFRAPITPNKYVSFYSDMPIWRLYPNNKDADNPDTNPALSTQSTMHIYYVKTNTSIGTDGVTITLSSLTATNTSSHKCPYNSGLILNTTGENLYFAPTTVQYKTYYQTSNYLHGSIEPINMDDVIASNPDKKVYVLKDGQFRRCSGGTLAAGKAYLMIPIKDFPGRTEAKELNFVLEDEEGETDAVKGVTIARNLEDDSWYNLQGVRVENPTRGIFIRSGKKYVFK